MNVAGIICEYNPIHNGHVYQIEETKRLLGDETAIICVMSGNFAQRGEFAIFEKHARAEAAVCCGADLVIELPLPYALSSAERFARGGVQILASLGVCTHLSFGSESGDLTRLKEIADILALPGIEQLIKKELTYGVSYAEARQRAVYVFLREKADMMREPNNLLAIEYLKALTLIDSSIEPITIKRTSSEHDAAEGLSSSAARKILLQGGEPWGMMPENARSVLESEISAGRGPVSSGNCEAALLSRLRLLKDFEFAELPDATEGLNMRLMRYARSEPTLNLIVEKTKTKRYAMSRIRRMILCACLGVTANDSNFQPPYIHVLAMNGTGRLLLREINKKAVQPVIIKPASAHKLAGEARQMFRQESAATDFYVLAYPGSANRTGGQEWRQGPRIRLG